jgi:valyl-tRNA synthetase
MKEISRRAAKAVESDEVRLHPAKFKNTYRHWMDNVRDWCISRQLWWGHRIPAYYYGSGENDFVVAETEEGAVELASQKSGKRLTAGDLRQDSDVLDTWASSWLWPMQVFNGFDDKYFDKTSGKIAVKKNKDLSYYYPTQVLVTAPEILFFWVARMIIAGYEYMGERPFSDVYLTGIVRDGLGRKMSKSLGNSPDPLELMKKYGADGVRAGMLFSSPAGNDLLFDEKLCEQGRNFSNKIWNAFRLLKGWEIQDLPMPATNSIAHKWFESQLNRTIAELDDHFSKFRISDALKTVYNLVWDSFCSWYLEMIKPEFGKPIDRGSYDRATVFFESALKLLHPFMPFISEELWNELRERQKDNHLIVARWPVAGTFDDVILRQGEVSFHVITQIRKVRSDRGISPRDTMTLHQREKSADVEAFLPLVQKLGNISTLTTGGPKPSGASFLSGSNEFTVPLEGKVDAGKERENILKDIDYHKGFLLSVNKKLDNERFVTSAPPNVLEMERRKKADAEAKIRVLEERLSSL